MPEIRKAVTDGPDLQLQMVHADEGYNAHRKIEGSEVTVTVYNVQWPGRYVKIVYPTGGLELDVLLACLMKMRAVRVLP